MLEINCSKKHRQSIVIAIAGPSASGKSALAKRLVDTLGANKCVIISQDDYYKDWARLPKKIRKKINFDETRAFDFALLNKHIIELKRGDCVKRPCYSFTESRRIFRTQKIVAKPIIIVEGLMPFFKSKLRKLFNLKLYIDINNAKCLSRRLKRDIAERDETIESVCERYFNEVIPMQGRYVEPQKEWADLVINGADCCNPTVINRIKKICLKNTQIL